MDEMLFSAMRRPIAFPTLVIFVAFAVPMALMIAIDPIGPIIIAAIVVVIRIDHDGAAIFVDHRARFMTFVNHAPPPGQPA